MSEETTSKMTNFVSFVPTDLITFDHFLIISCSVCKCHDKVASFLTSAYYNSNN